MPKIKEDSLFEVLDSNDRKDEIGQIYTAKDLMDRYAEYKKIHENDRNLNLIEPFRQQALENNDYSEVKWGRLEDVLDYKLSEPGEVEYENICKKIAKHQQKNGINTLVFQDKEESRTIFVVDQTDGLYGDNDMVTRYRSWSECFESDEFYSQLKDDINDLGIQGVFSPKKDKNSSHYGGYVFIANDNPYLSGEDFAFLLRDDPNFLETFDIKPLDLKNDLDKRRDFCNLPAIEFLHTYSYIDSQEYFLTELCYPEFSHERNVMLESSMEKVKLDYLLNKYHIHDYQDKAITLADIQKKDYKDIQLQIESPALTKDASITIDADDLDDFVKQLEYWGTNDFNMDSKLKNIFWDKPNDYVLQDSDDVQKTRMELLGVQGELIEFGNEITKWKEQSREYTDIKFNELDKEAFYNELQEDKYQNITTKEWPEGDYIVVDGNEYNIGTPEAKNEALKAAFEYVQNNIPSKPPKPVRAQVTGKNRVENKTKTTTTPTQPTKQKIQTI